MSISLIQHNPPQADFGDLRIPDLPWRIWLLIAVHTVMNLLIALSIGREKPAWVVGIGSGFVVAEASLLGMAAAISTAPIALTFALLILGFYVLLILECILVGDWRPMGNFVTCGTVIIAATFAACAFMLAIGFRFKYLASSQPLPRGKPLQFSISQIMLLTTFVAMIAGSVRWPPIRDHESTPLGLLFIALLVLVDPVLVLRLTLSRNPCSLRSCLFFAMLAFLCILLFVAVWCELKYWPLILLVFTQSAVIWITLVVVRWCRYRLVRATD